MDTTPEPLALDEISLALIRSAARLTRIAGKRSGSAYSSIAWRVLADLERTGAERVSELAQQQRVAQPTMTALVQRLEGEGWAERRPDPSDGRAMLVSITDAGTDALADYRVSAAAALTPHLAALTDDDRAALARAAELMQHLADTA